MSVQINDVMESEFSSSKPMTVATINVTVDLTPSKLTAKLAKEIHTDMARIAGMAGSSELGVDESEILDYLKSLTYIRIGLVNGDRNKSLNDYRRLSRHLAVPVMFYQCLVSIGVAVDRDYSIKFSPAYQIDGKELLSPETMETISDMMIRMEPQGLKIVEGLPSSEEGELDFMALAHVEDIVRGYKRSHPVYGFLAAFFAQKSLNEITGTMCRVVYGYDSDYELYVTKLYAAMRK